MAKKTTKKKKKTTKKAAPKKSAVRKRKTIRGGVEISGEGYFTEGIPATINVTSGVKLVTRQYESVSFQAGMTQELAPDADLNKAFQQSWDFLEKEQLLPKIQYVRQKFRSGEKG